MSRVLVIFALFIPTVCAGESGLRGPVALVALGDRVLVANRASGTISVIDTSIGAVIAEHAVARRIADMKPLGDSVLVLDDMAGELRRVSTSGASEPVTRVPKSATRLAVAADGRAFVSATWGREIRSGGRALALPFAPRELLLVERDEKLIVADAFGGRLAIVDTRKLDLIGTRAVRGHNIRGLAVSDDGTRLLVAQQRLHRALADYEELHWGRMISNGVEVFAMDDFMSREAPRGWLDKHGGIGRAMGDPGGVVTGPDGLVAISFSGVGEVVVQRGGFAKRIAVGDRPEAMAIADGRLFVANHFGDSVSVIDLARPRTSPAFELVKTISLGEMRDLTTIERGERLFFDARLSHDGWMSCHSCHTDGHSAGLVVDTLGDGDYGAPKRTPSLLGTRETGPWGWTASSKSLAAQVKKSIATTMHGDSLSDAQVADLVAYIESLEPPPSPASAALGASSELAGRGREIFESRGCADCHAGAALTSKRTYDVGLEDERERRAFNPPSLRGVSQRGRLFHDARAGSLEEVVTRFGHQLDDPLQAEEVEALLAYLRGL